MSNTTTQKAITPKDINSGNLKTEISTKTLEEEISREIIEDPTTFASHLKETEIILTKNKNLFKEYKNKWEELNKTLITNLSNTINEI